MTATTIDAPDLSAVKQRQQVMWASGDFHAVATLIQPVADMLCDAVDVQAGWSVLDVATGSGNAAIAAARCGCGRHRDRLRPGAPRARPAPRRGGGPGDRPGRGRRRGDPVRRPELRRGAVGVRLDVRAGPAAGRRRACARLPPRRPDRPRDLDADGFIGEMLKVVTGARPAAAGRRLAAPLGHGVAPAGAVRRHDLRAPDDGADLHVPLPLGRGVRRRTSAPTTGRR